MEGRRKRGCHPRRKEGRKEECLSASEHAPYRSFCAVEDVVELLRVDPLHRADLARVQLHFQLLLAALHLEAGLGGRPRVRLKITCETGFACILNLVYCRPADTRKQTEKLSHSPHSVGNISAAPATVCARMRTYLREEDVVDFVLAPDGVVRVGFVVDLGQKDHFFRSDRGHAELVLELAHSRCKEETGTGLEMSIIYKRQSEDLVSLLCWFPIRSNSSRRFSERRNKIRECQHSSDEPRLTPMLSGPSSSSSLHQRGWLQHVLVQRNGKVILCAARCCSNSLPSALNKNTLNARCSIPRLMFSVWWPAKRM